MLQISDVRSWAFLKLAKQIRQIIIICISNINGRKRCSNNCRLLGTICVALNWITIKTFVFKPTARIKDWKTYASDGFYFSSIN